MSLIDRQDTIMALSQLPFVGRKALHTVADMPEAVDLEAYQRGYEDGFREGRTRKELIDALDDDLK